MRETRRPPGTCRRSCLQACPAVVGTALLALLSGCQRDDPPPAQPKAEKAQPAGAAVRVVTPERKTVSRPIEQPGFNIEPFEETPLYPRVSGYVRKWYKDIGAPVKKGELLAELDVPEMLVELQQKEAAVRQARAQVGQAKAAVQAAEAQLARAKSQYDRLARLGKGGLLDKENVAEMLLGYEAARAGLARARADVTAAQAQVDVAGANRDYSKTMLGYLRITAPYAGVVTQRNVNTRDLVKPGGKPLFVVCQIDQVRVFVNVPGADAGWVRDGDPVTLQLQGAGGEVLQGTVTRNARSLDPLARTLRTEIDLPNPDGKLLPGMYVQARITVRHEKVWTLPAAAVTTEGDQAVCYRVVDGKAVRTPLQVGVSGGGLVEVLKMQVRPSPGVEPRWEPIAGTEEVVASDPGALSDGQPVRRAEGGK
jgi:RND family efflux transporter MFP subunit